MTLTGSETGYEALSLLAGHPEVVTPRLALPRHTVMLAVALLVCEGSVGPAATPGVVQRPATG